MSNTNIEIMFQANNLSHAMVRNINDNFSSVSFRIEPDGKIQVRIVLYERTEVEEELISDMMAEFSALQEFDKVNAPELLVGSHDPVENIVYQLISLS